MFTCCSSFSGRRCSWSTSVVGGPWRKHRKGDDRLQRKGDEEDPAEEVWLSNRGRCSPSKTFPWDFFREEQLQLSLLSIEVDLPVVFAVEVEVVAVVGCDVNSR